MKRKEFIKNTSWIAVGVSTGLLFQSCKTDEGPVAPPTTGDKEVCNSTTEDILGPYYRANAPTRSSIRINGEAGQDLRIAGQVNDTECKPIEGALVEIWQANDAGDYDNSSSEFKYRGKLDTDASGSYGFDTIVPGKYLNGSQFRPSHIHFKVSAAGYTTLVSQVYFKDDEHIEKDPWASDPSAELRILEMTSNNNVVEVTFDIILDKA